MRIVTKLYDEHGNFYGYHCADDGPPQRQISVLLAPDNPDYQAIMRWVEEGTAQIVEPKIEEVHQIQGEHGETTGFAYSGGIIYSDAEGELIARIRAGIGDGTIRVIPESYAGSGPKIDTIIFVVALDQPWRNVAGRFHWPQEYYATPSSAPVEVEIAIYNVFPAGAVSLFEATAKAIGAKSAVRFAGQPIQSGVMEVGIRAQDLQRLWRSESRRVDKVYAPFVERIGEMQIALSGRGSRGPSIQWLIGCTPFYLTHMLTETTNLAIERFQAEYGIDHLRQLTEAALRERLMVFHRDEEGIIYPRLGNSGARSNFQLEGLWKRASGRAAGSSQTDHLMSMLHRVGALCNEALFMEALVLLHAVFEVYTRAVLSDLAREDSELQKQMENLNAELRIKVITRCIEHVDKTQFNCPDALNTAANLESVRKLRNKYLHELIYPDGGTKLSTLGGREILDLVNPLTDVFQSDLFFSAAAAASRDRQSTVEVIKRTLQG